MNRTLAVAEAIPFRLRSSHIDLGVLASHTDGCFTVVGDAQEFKVMGEGHACRIRELTARDSSDNRAG
jgi:hypothetical protein